MNKVKKIKVDNGYYLFKLEQLLYDKNIIINKLMLDTNTDYKVIKRLMTGDILRIDILVPAKICYYLKCGIINIVEYKR